MSTFPRFPFAFEALSIRFTQKTAIEESSNIITTTTFKTGQNSLNPLFPIMKFGTQLDHTVIESNLFAKLLGGGRF